MGESKNFKILLFYKYQNIENPEKFAQEQRRFCSDNSLTARIIIAKEGINGTCAGKIDDADSYVRHIHLIGGLEDVVFKEHFVGFNPLKKIKVQVKNEIVNSRFNGVDLSKKGGYISPAEFNEFFEKSKTDESIVFMDVRNFIEAKVGRFKGAVVPKIKFFRELKEIIKEYSYLKDKKVVLYCAGGIRCEKASSLLLKDGFKEVYQLEGGIYNYCKKFPNGNFEGACFVFDDRMRVAFDESGNAVDGMLPEEKIISICDYCGKKSVRVVNDERQSERCLVLCCEECDKKSDVSRIRSGKRFS